MQTIIMFLCSVLAVIILLIGQGLAWIIKKLLDLGYWLAKKGEGK